MSILRCLPKYLQIPIQVRDPVLATLIFPSCSTRKEFKSSYKMSFSRIGCSLPASHAIRTSTSPHKGFFLLYDPQHSTHKSLSKSFQTISKICVTSSLDIFSQRSSTYLSPFFYKFVNNESSFLSCSIVVMPLSCNFKAVTGPMPHIFYNSIKIYSFSDYSTFSGLGKIPVSRYI